MNWWQYSSYNPPPPWWGGQQQIPVPPGVDPIRIMEFMDRVQRRSNKKDGDKKEKKDDKKTDYGKLLLWYFQAACVLYFLSPPIAALQHFITETLLSGK